MPNQLSRDKARFLIDANVRFSVGKKLQVAGYDVRFLAGTKEHDLSDTVVLKLAYDEKRIIITNDTDFGDLIFVMQQAAYGVILFRLEVDSALAYTIKLDLLLDQYPEKLVGHFIVVTDQHLRIRVLP